MTTTDIARRDENGLTMRPGQDMWTDKQRAALVAMGVSKDATNAELAVFAHVCQRTQLDPFTRQIYMIPRREKQGDQWITKQTIQVGIDGFRVVRDRVAERTGCQVELEDTVWYDAEGGEHAVWLAAEPPAACKVVLVKYQAGRALRYPAVLRTASYIQVNNQGQPVSQWRTQAEHMIEKCCEAFATRRAFPNDFSGVYLEEEMQGRRDGEPERPEHRKVTAAEIVREPEPAQPDPERAKPATKEQRGKLNGLLASLPVGPPETREQDQADLLSWLTSAEKYGTRGWALSATAQIEAALEAAGGDTEKCMEDLWTRYEASKS